jgi:predicted regulator of Ras-like GTPase activity (Roadblock/LC7/MglB family)
MSLKEGLKEVIAGLDGAQGIALVGLDGIVVEEERADSQLDLQGLGAEWCGIVRQVDKALSSMDMGDSGEVSALAAERVVVARKIKGDYFLLLVMNRDGNFGKGRYLLRRAEIKLEGEL